MIQRLGFACTYSNNPVLFGWLFVSDNPLNMNGQI